MADIRTVDEREAWIGNSRFFLDMDNILHIAYVGDIDEATVRKAAKAIRDISAAAGDRIRFAIDLNKSGRPSSGARKIMHDMQNRKKPGRVAFFGLHPVASTLAAFIMGELNKNDIKFFKTETNAMEWLKEDSAKGGGGCE